MKARIIYFLIIICSNSLYSQHKIRAVELTELEIVNPKFDKIMKLIDFTEKSCSYYNENVVFLVEVDASHDNNLINITSIIDRNLAFEFKPIGFYYYKKHLFLILGDIPHNIFLEKKQKQKFEYLEYDVFYEEYDSDGRRILRIIIDDSYSEWTFLHFDDNFIFENYIPCN